MAFVKVRDLTIYYEQGGSGPKLLFLSGTGGDLRRKPSVFERPIGQHFEILTLDQRGLGRTLGPDRDYTMLDYAEDAIGLMDAVGLGSVPRDGRLVRRDGGPGAGDPLPRALRSGGVVLHQQRRSR